MCKNPISEADSNGFLHYPLPKNGGYYEKTVVPFDIGESYLKIAQQSKDGISVDEMICNEEGKPVEMHLTGAVMSKESVSGFVHMFADAGLKLRTLIPQEMHYTCYLFL